MYDVITVHKMAKKQKVFAEIENFIPIGFRLQIKLTALIERSATKVLEFTYMIYLGPRPFFFDVMLCIQLRQAHTHKSFTSCLLFSLEVTANQHPNIVLELGT